MIRCSHTHLITHTEICIKSGVEMIIRYIHCFFIVGEPWKMYAPIGISKELIMTAAKFFSEIQKQRNGSVAIKIKAQTDAYIPGSVLHSIDRLQLNSRTGL